MCGIVGFISGKSLGASDSDCKAFYNLLLADTVRGEDGTGMYWQDDQGKNWYYKDVGPAAQVVTRATVKKFLDDSRFAVGHNRAATLGELDKEHTHPFVYENVTGVHNGTVNGWRELGAKEAKMDSMAIFECLDGTDPDAEETSKLIAKIGGGAYSLVWHDKRIDALRFARNAQRPMNFIETLDGSLWFGSELRMLEWVLDRNNQRFSRSFALDTNTLVTIPVNGGDIHTLGYTPDYGTTSTSKWGSYGSIGSSWDDDWDELGWGYSPRGTTSYNYAKRKIVVSDLLRIESELPRTISARSKDNIANAVRMMLGKTGEKSLHMPMWRYLDEYMRAKVEGATNGPNVVRVTVGVCKIAETAMYGYLIVDGAHVPVVMTGNAPAVVKDKIASIIASGNVAECPEVVVHGINLYHHADIAYRAGPVICDPDTIKVGPSLRGTRSDSNLLAFFGESHPEIVCENAAPDWEQWASMQGGLM